MIKRISILSQAIALSPQDHAYSRGRRQYIHVACHALCSGRNRQRDVTMPLTGLCRRSSRCAASGTAADSCSLIRPSISSFWSWSLSFIGGCASGRRTACCCSPAISSTGGGIGGFFLSLGNSPVVGFLSPQGSAKFPTPLRAPRLL